MIKILVGVIWTFCTTFFAVVIIISTISTGNVNGDPSGLTYNIEPGLLIPLFMIIILFIIGIIIIISGIRKIIKDSKTKKLGIICYGVIKNLKQTGTYYNEEPEYKALIDVINPNTNQLEHIEEVVGFNYNKFPIGSFVMCKYYEGDINFEHKIEPSEVPSSYREILKPATYSSEVGYNDIVSSDDR